MEDFGAKFSQFNEFMQESSWATKLVAGIGILILGWIVINLLVRGLKKVLRSREFDPSLIPFLGNLLKWSLRVVLLIVVAGTMGIETASLAAVIAAAGLAIGLALQGTLGHFASGVLILMTRPINVGDFVEVDGKAGIVREIQIFQTILETLQGNTIYVPNGNVISNPITNVTEKPTRRIDFDFGIGYGDDIQKARGIILRVLQQDERILDDPEPLVPVVSLGDSSVNLQMRAWVKSEDYWATRFDLIERVKTLFDENDIEIPYPHSQLVIAGGKLPSDG